MVLFEIHILQLESIHNNILSFDDYEIKYFLSKR